MDRLPEKIFQHTPLFNVFSTIWIFFVRMLVTEENDLEFESRLDIGICSEWDPTLNGNPSLFSYRMKKR